MASTSLWPLTGCLLLSGLFVGSLYIWPSKFGRNHPSTIKQRFFSVFMVVIISPLLLKLFITSNELKKFSLFEIVGLRSSGFFPAMVLPLLLTMVLFLGPLCMNDYSIISQLFLDVNFWLQNFKNLIWLRNVIIGPLSEEFTFRACMMPLLMQCYNSLTAIFVCSLFFGLAHVHHVIERYKAGESYKMLFIRALVQFSYTTLFGGYSAFLFIRTGHFISPFVVHAFCNIMAFPDFGRIFTYQYPKRIILMCLFIMGVVFWYILLDPLTNQKLFANNIYYSDELMEEN